VIIKLKEDGTVKVLDYGLAKALEGDADGEASRELSHSPTRLRQGSGAAGATGIGVILGTASYMSPEQATGKRVDERTDIWAFGTVLHEMFVGEALFSGETVSDILAAVLRAEIDGTRLPADTPEAVRRLLRRCLSRDPARRLPHIGAARLELEDALDAPSQPQAERRNPSHRWALALVAVAGVLAGLALYRTLSAPSPPPRPIRASIDLPPGTQLAFGPAARSSMAVSRDGSTLAFVAVPVGSLSYFESDQWSLNRDTRIYVRRLDTGVTTLLPDSDGAHHVFFSPDGRSVGFFADGELKTISVTGGAPVGICPVRNPWGAAWLEGDRIVFFDAAANATGLSVVSVAGGERETYSTPDVERGDLDHSFPAPVPGTSDLLVTMWTENDYPTARVGWLSADGGPVEHLVEGGSHAQALSSGYLVYARAPRLLAAPFDAKSGRLTGNPEIVLDDLLAEPSFLTPHFAMSPNGVLIWAAGGVVEPGKLWRIDPKPTQPRFELVIDDVKVGSPQMFPGRSVIAVEAIGDSSDDLYAYDLDRDVLTGLGLQSGGNLYAVPDHTESTIYYSTLDGVYRRELNRHEPTLVWHWEQNTARLSSVAADSSFLAYSYTPVGKIDRDIGVLDLDNGTEGRGIITTDAFENDPMFSPTASVIAYESDRTIRLQRFDSNRGTITNDAPVQVSRSESRKPFWSPDGRTLYFTSESRLMATKVRTTPALSASPPVAVLELGPSFLEPHGIGRMEIFGQDSDGRFIGTGLRDRSVITQLEAIFHWRPELDEP